MPTFRQDLSTIGAYIPGRSIEDLAGEMGITPDQIVKLASNESPDGPFPGVIEAAAGVLANSHRYPDNDATALSVALSEWLQVPADHIWPGAGSVALLGHVALAVGGPGTSAVLAWPSFVMYRTASRWAMTETVEVPLTPHLFHDLEAMSAAIRDDTTVVYLCNPNNPTGTIFSGDAMEWFADSVPERVLVVVDEAYHDFVTDPSYRSALPLALDRPNVIVLRTFSKIFGLAAHRVGFAVGRPATIAELRKTQTPFSISEVAQTAAAASLGDVVEHRRRVEANTVGRHHLLGVLEERDVPHCESHANFIYLRIGEDSMAVSDEFMRHGVIIRPMSRGWLRVTVGYDSDNEMFATTLNEVLAR
ncbi:MAG: histidinol-phosphate transaminase [Acidimicrobiia bacterium]